MAKLIHLTNVGQILELLETRFKEGRIKNLVVAYEDAGDDDMVNMSFSGPWITCMGLAGALLHIVSIGEGDR